MSDVRKVFSEGLGCKGRRGDVREMSRKPCCAGAGARMHLASDIARRRAAIVVSGLAAHA